MVIEKLVTTTFNSKWYKKRGQVTIKTAIRKDKLYDLKISVDINGDNYYKFIYGLPKKIVNMLGRNPSKTADILLFEECCVIADGEVFFVKRNLKGYNVSKASVTLMGNRSEGPFCSVHCRTSKHFCDGLFFQQPESTEKLVWLIETEPPF